MKQLLALILAILCSTSIALATTYTGTTGDCTYTLDTDEGTLVISGSGAMADYASYSSMPWYDYRSKVKTVTIEDGVTSIGDYAFASCSSLTSVTFGDNSALTSIGSYAFEYCSSLTSVTIPDGVTSIGDFAFYNCSSLTNVTIGSGVTSIGGYAFDLCWSLTSVTSLATTPPTCGTDPFYSSAWATLTAASYLYQYAEYWKDFYAIEYTDDAQTVSTTIIGQCGDDLIYTLNLENGTLVIEGSGDMYDYSSSYYAPWYTYASTITSVTISDEATSIGSYAFYYCSSLTSITIPDAVTSIGSYAFYYCSSLTSITIPDAVTSIGEQAFRSCSSLASITIPDGLTSIGLSAFYNCSSLTSITIPDGVTSIGSYAFYKCSSLTSITIPDGVTSIGDYAFYKCSSLTSVTSLATTPPTCSGNPFSSSTYSSATLYAASNMYKYIDYWKDFTTIEYTDDAQMYNTTLIGQCGDDLIYTLDLENGTLVIEGSGDMYDYSSSPYAPWHTYNSIITSVTISDEATSIGDYAFYYCSSITSITIPDGVTSIGKYAFYGCTSLTSVTIGSGVTSIGSSAFSSCSSLTSVTIGSGVTSIGSSAFSSCTSLTSITIPDGVTSIGDYAFASCSSLTSITFGDNSALTSIGSRVFILCSSLTSITIPDSVTSIGSEAFSWCSSLTSIAIPDAVTSIGSSAFWECTNLTSVTIGSGVTSIGSYTFYGCTSLTSITIPESVTSIGKYTFCDCSSLTSVTSLATTPPTCGSYPFSSSTYSSATLTAASNLYQYAEYWKNFSTIEYTEDAQTVSTTIIGQCGDNLIYTLDLESGELVIEGSGDMYDYSLDSLDYYPPWYTYVSSITSVTISDEATSIGSWAFNCCTSLTSVTIGSGVTSIGKYTFCDCSSLTSVTIPDGVTSIGDYAFISCSSLTSITIPDGVTSIGDYVFYLCWSLTSITIPDAVTSIGDYVFYLCSSLTSITIPESVTSIGSYAFYNCSSLTSVTSLATTPPYCGIDAFSSGMYIHTTLYAASTDYATAYCWSDFYNIVYIAGGSCGDDLKWYYSEGELIIFGSGDMYDYSSADEVPWAEFASEVTSIVVSSGVTSISGYAFYDCTSVTTVTSYDTTPPTVSENTFNSSTYSSAILNVTSTSYVLADYWKQFSTKTIVDASEEEDYSVYDIFNDDSDEDNTEVSIVTASTSAIRATGNTIVITTEAAQTAQVYSLNGQLIVKQAVAAGETTIGMPTGGVYVVALADGTKAKVLVK